MRRLRGFWTLIRHLKTTIFVFSMLLIGTGQPVTAQETSADLSGGSMLVGYDSRACDSSLEGSVRYNGLGPTNGLVGHWPLDETSGTTATERSFNTNDGTMQNGLTGSNSVTGVVDTALQFDGSNDSIDIASNPDYSLESFTYAIWIYIPTSMPSGWRAAMAHDRSGSNWVFLGKTNSADTIHWRWSSGDTMDSDTTISNDTWHHIAGTYDYATNTARLYVDGVLDKTDSAGGTQPTANDALLRIGRNTNDTETWTGYLDDARIYNRALSATEIAEIHALGDTSGGGGGGAGSCTAPATTYTSVGVNNYTVPANCDIVTVQVWGGGAGGANGGLLNGGNGGGGGAFSQSNVLVTPGNSYNALVGTGGAPGAGGGDSNFISAITVMAKGGTLSTGGQASSGVGSVKYNGGNGGTGGVAGSGGGGGSAGSLGAGGNGGNGTIGPGAAGAAGNPDGGAGGTGDGASGNAPGGGAAGGSTGFGAAGTGANGQVKIIPANSADPCDTTPVTITTTGSGVYVPPLNCDSVLIQAWSGGEGGTNGDLFSAGAGGAGGDYAEGTVSVTAGNAYNYTVGAGGTSSGNNGGDSWFIDTSTVYAPGGGAAGSPVGTTTYTGGTGHSSGGGGGGAGSGGNGSNGSGSTGGAGGTPDGGAGGNLSNAGTTLGGGGGGGASGFGGGANGAAGQLIITPSGSGGGGGGGSSCAAPYIANGVNFDSTNDYLSTGSFSSTDSKLWTGSFWFRFTSSAAPGSIQDIVDTEPVDNFRIDRTTGNNIRIIANNSSSTTILGLFTATTYNDTNWHHVMFSVDLSDTNKRHVYVDGVSDMTVNTYTDDVIDFTPTTTSVGGRTTGSNKFDGDIADLWLSMGTYIDLSVEANREKFLNSNSSPVYLGADGSTPTGSQPDVFLSGATENWHTNLGSGGGFTENGALTDATSNPPVGSGDCSSPLDFCDGTQWQNWGQ